MAELGERLSANDPAVVEDRPLSLDGLRKKDGYNAENNGHKSKWWNRLLSAKKRNIRRPRSSTDEGFPSEGKDVDHQPVASTSSTSSYWSDRSHSLKRKTRREKRERAQEKEKVKELMRVKSSIHRFENNLASAAKRTGAFHIKNSSGPALRRWKALSRYYCPKSFLDGVPRWSEGYACAPDECVRLFRTSQNITALIKTLVHADCDWLKEFLSIGGLQAFFESMEPCFLRPLPIPLWQGIRQIGCCRCLRQITNLPEGLDAIVESEYCINSLALVLSSASVVVRKQLMEFMACLCVYSMDGYYATLDILKVHQYLTSTPHFLDFLVSSLHFSESDSLTVSILLLINCLLRNEHDIDERMYLREEFFLLGLLGELNTLRMSEDLNVVTQVNVFDKHRHEDELQFDMSGTGGPQNPQHLFRCILSKVSATPRMATFINIMQLLTSIGQDGSLAHSQWAAVEATIRPIVGATCNVEIEERAKTAQKTLQPSKEELAQLQELTVGRNERRAMSDSEAMDSGRDELSTMKLPRRPTIAGPVDTAKLRYRQKTSTKQNREIRQKVKTCSEGIALTRLANLLSFTSVDSDLLSPSCTYISAAASSSTSSSPDLDMDSGRSTQDTLSGAGSAATFSLGASMDESPCDPMVADFQVVKSRTRSDGSTFDPADTQRLVFSPETRNFVARDYMATTPEPLRRVLSSEPVAPPPQARTAAATAGPKHSILGRKFSHGSNTYRSTRSTSPGGGGEKGILSRLKSMRPKSDGGATDGKSGRGKNQKEEPPTSLRTRLSRTMSSQKVALATSKDSAAAGNSNGGAAADSAGMLESAPVLACSSNLSLPPLPPQGTVEPGMSRETLPAPPSCTDIFAVHIPATSPAASTTLPLATEAEAAAAAGAGSPPPPAPAPAAPASAVPSPPPPMAGGPPPPPPPNGMAGGGPPPPPPPGIGGGGPPQPPPMGGGGPPPPPPMGGGGPPPPPPMGGGGPPPPPSLGGKGMGLFGKAVSSGPVTPGSNIKPNQKLRKVNWNKLPANKLYSDKAANMWRNPNDLLLTVDTKALEDLFAAKVVAPKKKQSAKSEEKKPEGSKVSLVDGKSSLNVTVFLKQFKAYSISDIMTWIQELNTEHMDIDQMKSLIKLIPDDSLYDAIGAYSGSFENLGPAEQFYAKLRKITHAQYRMDMMQLQLEFIETVEDIRPGIFTLNAACEELLKSRTLQQILVFILSIGNFLNHGTFAANAAGFKIESLAKLDDTKSNKARMTLMHYIAESIVNEHPQLLRVNDELKNLADASKLSLDFLSSKVNAIDSRIRAVGGNKALKKLPKELRERVKPFLERAEMTLECLKSPLKDIDAKATLIRDYFAEEAASYKLETFLVNMHLFLKRLNDAIKENRERVIVEEKLRKRELQAVLEKERKKKIVEKREAAAADERKKKPQGNVSHSVSISEKPKIVDQMLECMMGGDYGKSPT